MLSRTLTTAVLGCLVVCIPVRGNEHLGATSLVTVEFNGMTSDEGALAFAMWAGPEHWLGDGNTVRDGFIAIEDGRSVVVLEAVPYGEYAISAYHDENGNEKLDTGLFRIPKEPLGTSNDAKVRFGPPRYEDARFLVREPATTVTIGIRKLF